MGRLYLVLVLSMISTLALRSVWAQGEAVVEVVSPDVSPLNQIDDLRLELEFDAHLRLLFEQYKDRIPEANRSVFRKALDVARIQMLKMRGVRDMILRHGKQVGVSYTIGSIVSYVVGPAVSAAMGLYELAAAIAIAPIAEGAAAATFWWRTQAMDRQLAREFGMRNLEPLIELRRDLVGFDRRDHLVSAILRYSESGVDTEFSFEVLKRARAHRSLGRVPQVTVRDLERMILLDGDAGAEFLRRVAHEKVSPELFSLRLYQYVSEHPKPLRELLTQLQAMSREALTQPDRVMLTTFRNHSISQELSLQRLESVIARIQKLNRQAPSEKLKILIYELKNEKEVLIRMGQELQQYEYRFLYRKWLTQDMVAPATSSHSVDFQNYLSRFRQEIESRTAQWDELDSLVGAAQVRTTSESHLAGLEQWHERRYGCAAPLKRLGWLRRIQSGIRSGTRLGIPSGSP